MASPHDRDAPTGRRFENEAIFIFTALTSLAVVLWAGITLPETSGLNAPAGPSAGFRSDLAELTRSRRK